MEANTSMFISILLLKATEAQSCWGPLEDSIKDNSVTHPRGKETYLFTTLNHWWVTAPRAVNSLPFLACPFNGLGMLLWPEEILRQIISFVWSKTGTKKIEMGINRTC